MKSKREYVSEIPHIQNVQLLVLSGSKKKKTPPPPLPDLLPPLHLPPPPLSPRLPPPLPPPPQACFLKGL